jgi:hypothetical protein
MPFQTPFEPTKSFCYRVARYEVLNLIAQEPEARTYQPFRMIEVTKWAVPGFKDTLLRCFVELEESYGSAQELFEGVQA